MNGIADIALLPVSPELRDALDDQVEFERTYAVALGEVAALVREVVVAGEDLRRRRGTPLEWGGFLAIDGRSNQVVGCCGFVAAPDAAGEVEIAYFTFPPFERRGYATAMAQGLVALAISGGAARVVALTLPQSSTSTRILTSLGFRQNGTATDDEAGEVWRWELNAR